MKIHLLLILLLILLVYVLVIVLMFDDDTFCDVVGYWIDAADLKLFIYLWVKCIDGVIFKYLLYYIHSIYNNYILLSIYM